MTTKIEKQSKLKKDAPGKISKKGKMKTKKYKREKSTGNQSRKSSNQLEDLVEIEPFEERNEIESENESEVHSEDEILEHKKSLANLKEIDPEFYKFLEENDKKLLEFNVSDDENNDSEPEEDEQVHIPPEELEVASDEEDFQVDETEESSSVAIKSINLKMLNKWQDEIKSDKSSKTIICLIKAFHACLNRVSREEEQDYSPYKVEGAAVFNGILQLCVLQLKSALYKFLKIAPEKKIAPHKSKKFVKIRVPLRGYFKDLAKLLSRVTSPSIQSVLLKHLHGMTPFISAYSVIGKTLLRRLVRLWGSATDKVRILAFLCIVRIVTDDKSGLLELAMKAMHLEYVRASKFLSATSLPDVNFMRRSLTELFLIDPNLAYKYAFLYIRQLGIHLRNAVIIKKKEHAQVVCNWQYVNSLRLWADVLALAKDKPQLHGLIYPHVQITLGTIKLLSSAPYIPLRLHLLKLLLDLSVNADVFIPILPLTLETLSLFDVTKKNKRLAMKPLNMTCILRLSKSQLLENTTKDAIVEGVFALVLEQLARRSHALSFPDFAFLCIVQLKKFVKDCPVPNYTRKFKQILDAAVQNIQLIENEKKKVSFDLAQTSQVEAFETNIRNKGTPLMTFFSSFDKVHKVKKRKETTDADNMGDYKLPALKKSKKSAIEVKRNEKGQVELFPSSSEGEESGNEDGEAVSKKKRKKAEVENDGEDVEVPKKKKNKHKKSKAKMKSTEDADVPDIVEDINVSDW